MPAGSFPLRLSLGRSRSANGRGSRGTEPARFATSEGSGLPHEAPKRHLASAREQPSQADVDLSAQAPAAPAAVDAAGAAADAVPAWTPPSWDDIGREQRTRLP